MRNLLSRIERDDDAGFTLIELLVVITILGILAAIVVFSVSGIGDKGQTAACKTDTVTIRTAEEAYYAKNSSYVPVSTLQSAGFLSNGSSLHTVSVTAASGSTPASYVINEAGTLCGGSSGQAVDGSTTF